MDEKLGKWKTKVRTMRLNLMRPRPAGKGTLCLGVGPQKKGTFDVSHNLIKIPSGDFKQVSEEFKGCW